MKGFGPLGCILFWPFFLGTANAQETNLLNELDSITPKTVLYAYGTFKSTRVVSGHSIERMPEKQLDLRIEHRFGPVNQGRGKFLGLDQATTFFALEYGLKDWAMVGLNRTTWDKTVSGFAKFSLLRQSTGSVIMPVSVSFLLGTSIVGTPWAYPERDNLFSSRISYASQCIVARKCSEKFSLQFSPIWVHLNLVPLEADRNDVFALGFAGRYKLTRRISFNGEYYPVISPTWSHQGLPRTDALSFGFDIETGGHVFQLMLTNSTGMNEKTLITETTGSWKKGDLHLGFNISRVFSLKKR